MSSKGSKTLMTLIKSGHVITKSKECIDVGEMSLGIKRTIDAYRKIVKNDDELREAIAMQAYQNGTDEERLALHIFETLKGRGEV